MKKINFFYIILVLLFLAVSAPSFCYSQGQPSVSESSLLGFKKLTLTAGEQKEIISEEQLQKWILVEPTLRMASEKKSEIENISYCPSSPVVCRLVLTFNSMSFIKKESRIAIDKDSIKSFIDELSEKMDRNPVDAKFKIEEDGTISFIPDQKGVRINRDKSLDILYETLEDGGPSQENKELSLDYETPDPEIRSSDVNDLGIETLIGEGKSNFKGSPKNRIFNINVATEKFNGLLIKPGEEFSFVGALGPVDGEHGYAPELVIKHDKTEPEFGGGICQVSTTAFRAAINSGLKITARKNHAYPVAYYNPQGMDATVYIPRPDLKFKNNTPGNILIQTKIEGTILTFQFFGTNDGRKVEVEGPKILERNSDGSMKTTFTQKVYDKDGNEMITDIFNSNYDSPNKYPHPGEEKITSKPKGWSDNEWKKYKKTNGM